jgi:hypothetical protein
MQKFNAPEMTLQPISEWIVTFAAVIPANAGIQRLRNSRKNRFRLGQPLAVENGRNDEEEAF